MERKFKSFNQMGFPLRSGTGRSLREPYSLKGKKLICNHSSQRRKAKEFWNWLGNPFRDT